MLPLLLSFLSGVRELSATASLAEVQQPKAPLEFIDISGVSSRDLIASLCPVAVALVVASIRYYNEKQMQQRASDPQTHSSPLLSFGEVDVDTAPHGDCGDFGTALERRRSERFYVSDTSIVVFRVDGVLYRVHRHYFCSESNVLADTFVVCPPQLVEVNGKEQLEGTTDESAIEIAGVTPTEFEALLRFFYSSYDLDDVNLEYWVDLLSVSTRLKFGRIRARAIRTIDSKFESMCPVEKFAIGVMFDVEKWVFSSFSKICQREKPMSDAEARRLDIVTVARIARAREAIYNFSVPTTFSADAVVREAFKGALP